MSTPATTDFLRRVDERFHGACQPPTSVGSSPPRLVAAVTAATIAPSLGYPTRAERSPRGNSCRSTPTHASGATTLSSTRSCSGYRPTPTAVPRRTPSHQQALRPTPLGSPPQGMSPYAGSTGDPDPLEDAVTRHSTPRSTAAPWPLQLAGSGAPSVADPSGPRSTTKPYSRGPRSS